MTESTAKQNKLIINLLIISAFVVILNETVMGVAIPHLMADLGITALAAQWLTTAFLLTMAVVIPTSTSPRWSGRSPRAELKATGKNGQVQVAKSGL
ncbi:MAG: major facilitator transporter [Candidatus Saccharibacteria bacterium]|nr:major facilitator transporter [Candidatus Saccharibacteria bacterium]MDB5181142.1 major facilitator transporter [Candidatus Saccharibacteria bacterium]